MMKRINIVLPEETLRVLNRIAPKGSRSRLIDRAVRQYVKGKSRMSLRERLKEGYLANAKESLATAEEWFPLEEEAWEIANRRKSR
jgi:CopG family transcriptional regulator / antitoxin EndoAI